MHLQMFLDNYDYIWLNNTFISPTHLNYTFYLHMHLVNCPQVLNIIPLSLSSACLATVSAPVLVMIIVPFTGIYASL